MSWDLKGIEAQTLQIEVWVYLFRGNPVFGLKENHHRHFCGVPLERHTHLEGPMLGCLLSEEKVHKKSGAPGASAPKPVNGTQSQPKVLEWVAMGFSKSKSYPQ